MPSLDLLLDSHRWTAHNAPFHVPDLTRSLRPRDIATMQWKLPASATVVV